MKQLISLIMIMLASFIGFGQFSAREETVQELKKLGETYQQTPWLSFDVTYYYLDESKPGLYQDSLSGSFKINGSRYWYFLDNTELLYSKDYVVVLYKEDKIMYLSRPGTALKAANPLAMLDSFLLKNDNLDCRVVHENASKRLILDFKGNSAYKRLEYDIDSVTGFITKMINVVREDQLRGSDDQNPRNANNSYGVIEMRFNHYAKNSFDQSTFDTNRYFKKDGKQYVTVAPYADYKIFLGSPGL